MAVARQPHALNNFIRAVKSCRPTTYQSIRTPPISRFEFHSNARQAQTTYPNRYGPAASETLPPPPKPSGSLAPVKGDSKPAEARQSQPNQPSQSPSPPQEERPSDQKTKRVDASEGQRSDNSQGPSTPLEQAAEAVQAKHENDASSSTERSLPPEEDPNIPLGNKELDIVLSVPAPSEVQSGKPRHPHLEPSPYEHHFDTYTLVQDLASNLETYSEKQAITIMKSIRLMLANNLDLAKEGLISKSDVENESYLFRAACSELRTTMETARATENQRQRTQRAQQQHEFDILNQKVTQDMQTLREELKGMFNDRKMGLQEEKQRLDAQISELNYKITVLLNSDSKSEVEGLRWVLTRRAALAIGTAAFMTLSALQYYSVKSREYAEIEKKRVAAQKVQEERMASESQARYTTPSRNSGTQTAGGYEETLG